MILNETVKTVQSTLLQHLETELVLALHLIELQQPRLHFEIHTVQPE